MTVCVLGSANLDIVIQVTALPLPGETVLARAVSDHLGGKGANQAVAAARAGAATTFLGAIGQDETGAVLTRSLSDSGVDTAHLHMAPGRESGRAYVMVAASGENSIIVSSGANAAVLPGHLPSAAVQAARVRLSQLETPIAAVTALFSTPRAPGDIRILNAAPALPEGRALFGLIEVLVVNETELMTYAGLNTSREAVAHVEAAASRLIERPDQAVIVTLGAAGAAIVRQDGTQRVPGFVVDAIDTTGAGDCFCGVLAAELDRGADLESAVRFANAAAALSVTRLGAATSMPSRQDVAAFLNMSRH